MIMMVVAVRMIVPVGMVVAVQRRPGQAVQLAEGLVAAGAVAIAAAGAVFEPAADAFDQLLAGAHAIEALGGLPVALAQLRAELARPGADRVLAEAPEAPAVVHPQLQRVFGLVDAQEDRRAPAGSTSARKLTNLPASQPSKAAPRAKAICWAPSIPAISASFNTVFQFRAVPRAPSRFSIAAPKSV